MRKRLELVDLSLIIATVHIWIVLKNVIVDGLHIILAVTSVAMVFLVSYLILDAISKSVIIRREKRNGQQ